MPEREGKIIIFFEGSIKILIGFGNDKRKRQGKTNGRISVKPFSVVISRAYW